jgi:hypothetical protein
MEKYVLALVHAVERLSGRPLSLDEGNNPRGLDEWLQSLSPRREERK